MDDHPDEGAAEAVIEMPMFPLGSVLFPGGVLPLHIFEVRYQQLLNHALETDRRFGVVLISRGSEVGGGELRTDIGTVAHIEEHQRFDDGRAAVMCSGTTRFEVVEWLDDDPYPRARVRELATEAEGRNDRDLLQSARQSFVDLIELGQQLGRLDSMPDLDWDDDIETATWQLADAITLHPARSADDSVRSLARADRLRRIEERLKEVYADLELMGGLDSSS